MKRAKGKRAAARIALLFSFFVLTFSFAPACAPKRGGATTRPTAYFGPTEPMVDVVNAINANNRKLPTLWASIREMEASIVDDRGRRHDEVLRGTVLYRSPREVSLVGTKDPVGAVVTIGSNRDTYWLVAKDPGPDTAWWGRYEHLGSDCAQPIPIRPDLILEVLGVSAIETDFSALPAPVMRFNPQADAYMFVWVGKLPNRFVATREIWYDRKTKRPTRVALFDEHGRTILSAFLSRHVPVEVPGLPEAEWPTVAGEYRLFFPDSGSRLRLAMGDVKLSNRGAPNDKTFTFVPQRAGVSKVIQLDEACGP